MGLVLRIQWTVHRELGMSPAFEHGFRRSNAGGAARLPEGLVQCCHAGMRILPASGGGKQIAAFALSRHHVIRMPHAPA